MDSISTTFLNYLEREKPVVLFLGQSFHSQNVGEDRILNMFLERLGRQSQRRTWNDIFEKGSVLELEDSQWLAERFERTVYPDSILNVLEVGWSGVFTSSIDPKIVEALETRGRMPEAVLARDHYARVPRSRSRPAVHYLFGKANETEPHYRAPRSRVELKQRLSIHANQFINRIPETVTALGLFVIDGYDPNVDWLPVDDLLAPLSQEAGLKILWFGMSGNFESDFYDDMVARGVIHPDSRTLPEIIAELQALGKSQPLGNSYQSETGTVSLRDGKIFQVTPSLRLRVEAAASIIDDTWTDIQSLYFGSEEAEAFRRFHGDLGGIRGLIEGIGRGYSIKRSFEDQLRTAVERSLKNFGETENVVIVHGQSGVGKSIALARLAYVMRTQLYIPVLFTWGRVPTPHEVDEFCAESERAGSVGTLILCDGNQMFERYRELATGLRSRGRRTVVVGTSYRTDELKLDKRFIEAPSAMSSEEVASLQILLSKFSEQNPEEIQNTLSDKNTLALLYRYLSASRARISGGVAEEARVAEQTIRLRAKNLPRNTNVSSQLAQKLIQAGLSESSVAVFEEDAEGAQAGSDTAGRLIDYVMVVGRLDCAIPVNLVIRALRALSQEFDLVQIAYLFEELDLFRWRMADAEGNDLLVQCRLQLEAELICKRRLGNVDSEVDRLIDIIESVRGNGVDKNSELDFLLDLLPKLNKDGPRKKSYERGYLRIAAALTNLRSGHHLIDSRLMLQESAFRRAAVYVMDKPAVVGEERFEFGADRNEVLDAAREVVELALDLIKGKRLHASRKTYHNLLNERASIYGYLTVGLAKENDDEEEVWSHYLAARTAISKSIAVAGGYYSQDVGMWTPNDVLNVPNSCLSDVKKAELKADILSIIDEVNPDRLSLLDAQRFHTRRYRISDSLQIDQLADDAFDELERLAPNVAYYLKARSLCAELFSDTLTEPFSTSQRACAARGAEFLEERFGAITGDIRALQLLLRLKWIAFTGHRFLRAERFPIPHDRIFQDQIYSIVLELNRAAGDDARNVFRFVEATLEWLKGDYPRARELFKQLAHDTEFEDSSRVVRRLLLEPLSSAQGFRGRIEKKRNDGHWVLSVTGLDGHVDLLERDFPNEALSPGREIGRFNIAFNYLGPIADPILRYGVAT